MPPALLCSKQPPLLTLRRSPAVCHIYCASLLTRCPLPKYKLKDSVFPFHLHSYCPAQCMSPKSSETESHSVMSDSVTLRTVACQPPLSMGILQTRILALWPFPSPGDLPNPGIEPGSLALQADSLLSEPPGKPHLRVT